jgi:hypothetical protein
MRPTPIDSRRHGILDYMTGAQLQGLPRLLGYEDRSPEAVSLRAAGAIHAGYSVFTDYELGAIRVIPFKAHLALDALWTAGLAASPFVTGAYRKGTRHWLPHVLLAAYEAMSLALSETQARDKAPERAREANALDARERVTAGSAFDPAPAQAAGDSGA